MSLKVILTVTEKEVSLDSKSADKELEALTPEKSKSCVTAFTNKTKDWVLVHERRFEK